MSSKIVNFLFCLNANFCDFARLSSKTNFLCPPLVGDRSLNVVAVAMSLIASVLNGIFVVGLSAEVHYHGVEMTYMVVAAVVITSLGAHIFIPRFRRMRLTSAYEVDPILRRISYIVTVRATRQHVVLSAY